MKPDDTVLDRAFGLVKAGMLLPFALLGPAGLKLAATVGSSVKDRARKARRKLPFAGRERK